MFIHELMKVQFLGFVIILSEGQPWIETQLLEWVKCCVNLVLDSKYVQFQIIFSLLWSMIVDTSKVDPHLNQYEKCQIKPSIGKIASFVRGGFHATWPVVTMTKCQNVQLQIFLKKSLPSSMSASLIKQNANLKIHDEFTHYVHDLW